MNSNPRGRQKRRSQITQNSMIDCLAGFKFFLAKCSVKEAKRRFLGCADLYIVDIGKVIRDLGYSNQNLTKESEFIINYTVRRKIDQGIYNTKNNTILILHKNISPDFVENLDSFLREYGDEFEFDIEMV